MTRGRLLGGTETIQTPALEGRLGTTLKAHSPWVTQYVAQAEDPWPAGGRALGAGAGASVSLREGGEPQGNGETVGLGVLGMAPL